MKWILPLLVIGGVTLPPNTTGSRPWKRHVVDAADPADGKKGADGVRIKDANRDRRPDVVTGWEDGKAIRVCLNPGPELATKPWPAVTVGRVSDAEDAVFTDLDGDLRMDVLSACEGKTRSVFVHWAPSSPQDYLEESKWETAAIPCTEGAAAWMFLVPFDVDRDGDMDIITGSKGANGAIGWLVNPGQSRARKLDQWRWVKLASAGWIMSICHQDLDGDGHREFTYSDRKGDRSGIYTMSHLNSAPWVSEPRLLGFFGKEVRFMDIGDLNGDGKPDIATTVAPDQFGYLIQPNETPFRKKWAEKLSSPIRNRAEFGESKAVKIADLSGDGKPEIVATGTKADGGLSGAFHFPFETDPDESITATDIGGPEGIKFDRIEMVDLDGDGDLDLLTCEERAGLGVFWYENPGK